MICSSVNRDFRIVRLLISGLYPNLEEFQGLRSRLGFVKTRAATITEHRTSALSGPARADW